MTTDFSDNRIAQEQLARQAMELKILACVGVMRRRGVDVCQKHGVTYESFTGLDTRAIWDAMRCAAELEVQTALYTALFVRRSLICNGCFDAADHRPDLGPSMWGNERISRLMFGVLPPNAEAVLPDLAKHLAALARAGGIQ